MAFPRLTIAVKLYAIFALLATVAVALAVIAQQIGSGAPVADTHSVAWPLGAMAVLVLLLAASGAAVVGRTCARLIAITRVTGQLADGQIDVAIPHRERRDEIGALAASIAVFQSAMRNNKDLNQTVRDDAEARRQRQDQIAAEIAAFSADVEVTLRELMKMSGRAKKAATELAHAVDITVDRTGRATQSSEESNTNVRDIASAADELAMSVLEIERQVSQSNDIAMKAVAEAGATNDTVKELSEAAGRIGDVIRLINDIAEQTNLLALNATIEAARAGDAGRGFAVVAGEVKDLAQETARATDDIGRRVEAIQADTAEAVRAIAEISAVIVQINDAQTTIAGAVEEQNATTQEMTRNVAAAAVGSGEIARNARAVNVAARDTSRGVQDTHASAADLARMSEELQTLVGRYRL